MGTGRAHCKPPARSDPRFTVTAVAARRAGRYIKPIMTAPRLRSADSSFELHDEAATGALARALAMLVRAGDVITLYGDLGSGKTTFARAFINALARPGRVGETGEVEPEEVPSPTFTLLQIYDRVPAPVWHFDFYRLEQPADVVELGFDDALAEGVVLVEWPDRLGAMLPAERLEVHLTFGATEKQRHATLVGRGRWPARLTGLSFDASAAVVERSR